MTVDYNPGYSGRAYQGDRYDTTRYVPAKEIAAAVRATVKQAQKDGRLPDKTDGFTYSVRADSYAGGQAVRIEVTAPRDRIERAASPDAVDWYEAQQAMYGGTVRTEESARIDRFLTDEGKRYIRDDSDSMTDYFNVSCYVTVSFRPV